MSQLKLPYITSFILLDGTSSFRMNRIVFVGFTLLSLSPLVNPPNSFADDFKKGFFVFWMSHELLIVQVRIHFFVVDQLCSLDGLCGLSEVSVSLRDTRHCLCCHIPSESLSVVVALRVGFWFLYPWSPRI